MEELRPTIRVNPVIWNSLHSKVRSVMSVDIKLQKVGSALLKSTVPIVMSLKLLSRILPCAVMVG